MNSFISFIVNKILKLLSHIPLKQISHFHEETLCHLYTSISKKVKFKRNSLHMCELSSLMDPVENSFSSCLNKIYYVHLYIIDKYL